MPKIDSEVNDDPHSSKYIRLNDGSRRRSSLGNTFASEDCATKSTDSRGDGSVGDQSTAGRSMAQDAHLRHYQEHLEERRLKNKRLREGKMVTLLRKKPTVVEKRDVACQVTPADLGLDDWEDEEEEDEEEEDYAEPGMSNYGSRPASAAPGPGPWQDVSTTNFNAEAYQQWYGQHWLGQNEQSAYQGYEGSEGLTQLTQEQTYRYVYYYYNYYAAMEADEELGGQNNDLYASFGGYAQNHHTATAAANQPGPWQDTDRHGDTPADSRLASKRHMRDLFDEWRGKYEEWYRASFGKDVKETQREEDVAIMAHKAQLEAARLAQLRQEQEEHLERPGRPDSLLPAPPMGHDMSAMMGVEASESLLPPPPPPPSAPPPETPPPPPETPRPETPAAQAAAAAAAAHVLGANMSTAADVAAAIARLSNSDLTAILSSVNRGAAVDSKSPTSASPSDVSSTVSTSSAGTTLVASAPTLLRLPPLPVIGLPNPLATPIFPPPMPVAIRRDGLNATATTTVLPAPAAAATLMTPTPVMIALPPTLPASLAPPSLPTGLPSIPQTMLLQPTMKFGPPFKPFGVFQGTTEDKWGPDCPLGRYGQRKEEEEKEAKKRQEAKRKLSEQSVAALQGEPIVMNGDHSPPVVFDEVAKSDTKEKVDKVESPEVSLDDKENKLENDAEKKSNEKTDDVSSDKDESDTDSVSSGDSLCSTATQSVAIGPRRTRMTPSIAGGMGIMAPGVRSNRLLLANAVNTSSIPVEKLTSLAESAAKRAVSDGVWYAPSQPLNSLRLPKQAMIHTLQTHLKPKIAELQVKEKDPKLQLTLSYAKFLIDTVRHLLDMPVQFVVGSMSRLASDRARLFYGSDLGEDVNSMKLCDVCIGDVFIAQGAAGTTLGAKEAASRQAFKVLSRPGYILGSTRLWQENDHLVLCISEFPLTVPILPPFLLDPCSPAIVKGPQPPSELGIPGPDGDGVDNGDGEVGWEMEDEEDWQLQSVAINPKPLENLWLYENFEEVAVANALRQVEELRKERLKLRLERQKRRENADPNNRKDDSEDERTELLSTRSRRRSSLRQTAFMPAADDVHEAALADMAALSLTKEDGEGLEETVQFDDPDLSAVETDPEALAILTRSCDFSHMMLSVEVEVNRDASFTCCVFIDRQFCADATDQQTVQLARNLAASRALALLRLSQPAVGLDSPEVSDEAVVDSLMWTTHGQTVRPVIPLMISYGMNCLEWDRLFMFYAESATIEPFFISQKELSRTKWPEVKKEAEKWGLLVKESPVLTQEAEDGNPLSLFVCKRMPLTTVKRKLIRQGRCGHFLLLRRGVYPTAEDEELNDDDDDDDSGDAESVLTASEADPTPMVAVDVKEEPMEEEPVDDLIFLGGAVTSNDCEIIDDLPKTRIPGFDY